MKIQCNVCEMAEATVLCCADEAALCWTCDEKIHAANKLASKHQRVLLSTHNSQMPMCDICQETVGYFFCLEDRALLCRKCDVAIHTVNTLVSSHQRFLLTGVKVGLEAAELGASTSSIKSHTTKDISDTPKSFSPPVRSVPLSSTGQYCKPEPIQAAGAGDFAPPSLPFAGGSSADGSQQWEFDEFLGLTDLNQNYNYIDNVSSKVIYQLFLDQLGCIWPIAGSWETQTVKGLGRFLTHLGRSQKSVLHRRLPDSSIMIIIIIIIITNSRQLHLFLMYVTQLSQISILPNKVQVAKKGEGSSSDLSFSGGPLSFYH